MSNVLERISLWGENDLTVALPKLENKIELEETGSMLITEPACVKKEWINITNVKTNERWMGIYKVINRVNGKYYVGSSNHIHRRKRRHRSELRLGCHYNDHLQKAWNKYGEANFDFIFVESVTNEIQLLEVEQRYLDIAKNEQYNVYNTSFSAERVWLSEMTKQKISKSMMGRKTSEQMKQKCRMNMLGKNNHRYGKPQSTTIHKFQNKTTKEIFVGTQYDLTTKYNLPCGQMSQVANGNRKSLWGWKLFNGEP